MQDDTIEFDKSYIIYGLIGVASLLSIISPYIGAPAWMPVIGFFIALLALVFYVIRHENFKYNSISLRILMVSMILTGGTVAVLTLSISGGLLVDTIDYFSVGPVGIGRTSIWLAISGAVMIINFVLLKLTAMREGFR